MSYFDPKIKQINGPINLVRLEGKINNIKKVIYVFFEVHMDLSTQNKCNNIYSKNIEQYLFESFKNTKDQSLIYDFFLEINPEDIVNFEWGSFIRTYLDSLRYFFEKTFSIDPDLDKVSISKYLKNVRLHYMDIRIYWFKYFFYAFHEPINIISSGITLEVYQIIPVIKHLKQILDIFKRFVQMFELVIESKYKQGMKFKVGFVSEDNLEIDLNNSAYFINKTYFSYKHPKIKIFIQKIMKNLLSDFNELIMQFDVLIKELNTILDKINNAGGKLTKDIVYGYGMNIITNIDMKASVLKKILVLNNDLTTKFANLMDVNFLRRFLDKDYITNAITYTGAAHSNFYVKTLVTDFNFKITHSAYVFEDMTIDKLNSIVKKIKFDDMDDLLFPKTQCTNVTSFPKDFL